METIFMNTENSKTNESNKFIYQFTDKLNLKKTQITKILDWLIYVFTTPVKTLNLHTTTRNLKYLLQLGMINLICLMVLFSF